MKEDRKFLRQCTSCKGYKAKEDLIKITRDYITGESIINNENKVQGRSIYICKSDECIKKFLKNKKNLNILKSNQNKIQEELNNYII